MINEYEKIVNDIQGRHRFGSLPGVEISKIMAAAVGNPQKDLKFVHIAGTNGKGSTAAFLREIAVEANLKVGLFTSPHLVSFRERIQIGHEYISEEDVVRIGKQLLSLELPEGVNPTMFDFCFIMAMIYFKEQNVDLVILETGLGGKLDSTNIIDAPLATIITHIGYDHTAILGDTLEAIAAEKAGIIKKDSYLIMEEQEYGPGKVIIDKAMEQYVPYTITYETELDTSLKGSYQKRNAACAIAAAKRLRRLDYLISDADIENGLSKAVWPGRMQVIKQKPLVIVDGAHNPDGVNALRETIEKQYGGRSFNFIMGVMADKDYVAMLKGLTQYIDLLTTVTVDNERALQAEDLARECARIGIRATTYSGDVTQLIEEISEDTIIFGSLYFIGEILKNKAF